MAHSKHNKVKEEAKTEGSKDKQEKHKNHLESQTVTMVSFQVVTAVAVAVLIALIFPYQLQELGCKLGIVEYEWITAEREARVKLAYALTEQTKDVFALLPQANGDWPAPKHLYQVAGNLQDAVASLAITIKDRRMNEVQRDFQKDGTTFVTSIETLAGSCIKYAQRQHRSYGQIKPLMELLNQAFCNGNFVEVDRFLVLLFNKIREIADDTKEIVAQLGTVLTKHKRLRDTSNKLNTVTKVANAKVNTEITMVDNFSSLYKWWHYEEYKRQLLELREEGEYMGYVLLVAEQTAIGLAHFEQFLIANREQLDYLWSQQDDLVKEFRRHSGQEHPEFKPAYGECAKYTKVMSDFVEQLNKFDDVQEKFMADNTEAN